MNKNDSKPTTTDAGCPVSSDEHSLTVGRDGPILHASYMVGCQKTGEAIIVDPSRDIQQYLDAAAKEDLKIVAAADTHIHADYVSGARELADRHGAKLYLSAEGPAEWKYLFADQYPPSRSKGTTASI